MPSLLNNRYRIIRVLARGGFGETFLAEDSFLPSKRLCLIKQLRFSANDPKTYELVLARFQREAAILEELGRGNSQIPELYAYFEQEGQFFLVQEWIDGLTLANKVQTEGIFSESAVSHFLEAILPIFIYVHDRGIVHRDVKPDNIILRKKDGLPVLIDFGAVKESVKNVLNSQAASSIIIGTAGYMSPEQSVGRPVFSSDLYGLGLTAIYLLTGKSPQELPPNDRTGELEWQSYAPTISNALAQVLDRSIQYHPRDRFATAREMLEAFQASRLTQPPQSIPAPPTLPPTTPKYSPVTISGTPVPPQASISPPSNFPSSVQAAANRVLVIREQARRFQGRFAESLAQSASQLTVFHVYGIGGVGKTTLLQELQRENIENARFATVSFDLSLNVETPLKLMAKLYKEVEKVTQTRVQLQGILLPVDPFTSLYEKYQQTLYQLQTQSMQGKETLSSEQIDTVKELVKFGLSTVGRVMPIPGGSQTLGSAGDLSVDAARMFGQLLQNHQATRKQKELQSLMLDPLTKLTQAFASGLIRKAKKRPIVLVLDTFERASPDINTWLCLHLLANTEIRHHQIRLLIAGRYSLLKTEGWQRLNQNWQMIYERELTRFDEQQTQSYLTQLKINEPVQKVYRTTKGLPYYLNWIREQKEQGIQLDLSQGNYEISQVILQGLSSAQKRVVQLAACCRWFDGKLLEYLMNQQEKKIDFYTAVDETQNCFEWLMHQDFVKVVQHRFCLDDVARSLFRLSLWREDAELYHQTHTLIADYFKKKAAQRVSPNSTIVEQLENPDWCNDTIEVLYHQFFAQPGIQQRQFLKELSISSPLGQSEVMRAVLTIIDAEADIQEYLLLPHEAKTTLTEIRKGTMLIDKTDDSKLEDSSL